MATRKGCPILVGLLLFAFWPYLLLIALGFFIRIFQFKIVTVDSPFNEFLYSLLIYLQDFTDLWRPFMFFFLALAAIFLATHIYETWFKSHSS